MKALHGNTDEEEMSVKVCNIDGLQKEGRWEFVIEHTSHFMALSETHVTILMEK